MLAFLDDNTSLPEDAPVLDIHATLDGYALSLVWFCPVCGDETRRQFVMGFPTLTLAARARAKAMSCKPTAHIIPFPLPNNNQSRGA